MMLAAAGAVVLFIAAAAAALRSRNMHLWIGSHLREKIRPRRSVRPADVYFCFADHFEPFWGRVSRDRALARVSAWCERYPEMADRHVDAAGRRPRHTYFYPEEEYDAEILDRLAALCRRGYGDVEVHLHHDNDTAAGLREKLVRFKKTLHEKHGFLKKNPATNEIEYGFVHGNWALDNSRPDGRWCGVADELSVLKETGCYADFTLPSAPSDTQTRKINSLYFARGRAGRSKSHDEGRDAAPGAWDAEGLLMVQGPLTLNWKSRKWGVLPRIENAEISYDNPPTRERVALWVDQRIQVRGRPGATFIKVHTHGLQDRNLEAFFAGGMLDSLYSLLAEVCSEKNGFRLRFVSSREMVEAIRGLCVGGKDE